MQTIVHNDLYVVVVDENKLVAGRRAVRFVLPIRVSLVLFSEMC